MLATQCLLQFPKAEKGKQVNTLVATMINFLSQCPSNWLQNMS